MVGLGLRLVGLVWGYRAPPGRYNGTSKWLQGLPQQLRDLILTLARRMHATTMRERRASLKAATAGKFRRQAAAVARMIRNLLRYESVVVFTTTEQWEAWQQQVGVGVLGWG